MVAAWCCAALQGYKSRLAVHLRRASVEPVDEEVQARYHRLMHVISSRTPVGAPFHAGHFQLVSVNPAGTGWRLLAWRWTCGPHRRLVVINYSDEPGWAHIPLPDAQANGSDIGGSSASGGSSAGGGNIAGGGDSGGDSAGGGDGFALVEVTELLSGVVYSRSLAELRDTGLVVGVDPFAAQILQF
jgi:hypothetical protein